MRLRRTALWLTCGIIAFVAAGLLWLQFGDLGVFKPRLEHFISEKTGREFAIDGRFDVDFGRETVIIAEGIRFANADWAESGDMLDVAYLELRIDTLSLLAAPLTIELIKVRGAAIRLEQPASGEPNWALFPPSATDNPEPEEGALGVIARHIDTADVRLIYNSASRTGPLELRIAALQQQHRADDFLELTLSGDLDGRPIAFHVVTGTWNALLAQADVAYEIDAQLDNFKLTTEGTIDDLVAPRRPSLTFAASGPDINELLRMLKVEEGGSGDIDIAGSIRPGEDKLMAVSVEGRLGQATIDATATLPDLRSFERFEVVASASSPDLSRILALFGLEGVREAPFTIDILASRKGPMLAIDRAHLEFAGTSFDLSAQLPGFPSVDGGSAGLRIVGTDFARMREVLRLPGKAEGPYSLGLELHSDAAGEEILTVDLTSTLGNLKADGQISSKTDFMGSAINFAISSDSLARIGEAYGMKRLPDLPLSMSGSLAVEADAIRLHGPVIADIENTRLMIEGRIAKSPRLEGSSVSVGIETPDLARIVGMFAAAEKVPPLPAKLGGEVLLEGRRVRFNNVRGIFGRSSVDAAGTLELAPRLTGSEFSLTAAGPAFEELVAHLPGVDVAPGEYELSGALAFGAEAIRLEHVELTRERGEATADVMIGSSQAGVLIVFDVGARGGSIRSILPSIGDFALDDAPFAVSARGELDGANLKLAQFDVQIGDATVAARGEVDLELGGRATDFEFDLDVPSLARLGQLGERRPREQGLSISARLRGDRETVDVENLVARLGESDIRGSLQMKKGDVPTFVIELRSDVLSVAPVFEEAGDDYEPAPRFADGRLIPDVKIPFDAMRKLNASVSVDIGELRRETADLTGVTIRAQLQDGALRVHDAALQAGGGWLQARAALEPAAGEGRVSLAIQARKVALGLFDPGDGPAPSTDVDVNLTSSGADLRSLAGNANGVLFADAHEFTVANNVYLKRLYGDLLNEILETINPFTKSDTETRIDCVVLPVEIDDGQLSLNPDALIRTDKISIVSRASIDLKSEKMEMSFRTTPRQGLTISAGEILNPFVMVVGTLAEPRLAVDAKGTLISGGAAVATGGLSILARATWERLNRSKNPCETAAQQGLEVVQDRFAEFPARSGTQPQ